VGGAVSGATKRLPSFVIIGAAKSGTTSLYHYLDQHPDVFMSPVKETNFFAWSGQGEHWGRDYIPFPVRTLEEYEALFADAGDARAVGEASPLYLETPGAAARIHELLPDARLVVILREPVARARSAYAMRVRKGVERRGLAEAFAADPSYLAHGRYHALLAPFYDAFPADRILVLEFGEFRRDTAGVMRTVHRFIGVDPDFQADLSATHNEGGFPRSRLINRLLYNPFVRRRVAAAVPDVIRRAARAVWRRNLAAPPSLAAPEEARLRAQFRDDTVRLSALTGRDFSSWLAPEREAR
jgi:hypothetical protein